MTDKLDTYERDDREPLPPMLEALAEIQTFAEALLVMEKYGLSLFFDLDKIEWRCSDPKGMYQGIANTPAGAIIFWDWKRQEVEGEEDKPKLKLVQKP